MNSIRAAWVWRSLVALFLAAWSVVGLARHDYRPLFTTATLATVVAAAFLLNSTQRFASERAAWRRAEPNSYGRLVFAFSVLITGAVVGAAILLGYVK